MKNNFIKSPMNYVGGKHKLLPQIIPLFPSEIDIFVDLMCGGFNVGVNVNAKKIIGNDLEKEVIEIYEGIQENGAEKSLELVKNQIEKYNLSKTNREGFNAIRKAYNEGERDWYVFYAMITHAFNYQIRFNKQGEYNMPFGANRSWFNPRLEKNFIRFAKAIEEKNIEFTKQNFLDFDIEQLTENDFVYIDPPYLISCASYNEQDGWNIELEKALLDFLDQLNERNIKFALSNVLKHKGKNNDLLIEWSKKYKIHYLDYNYDNCNYQDKNNEHETIEVLIVNY